MTDPLCQDLPFRLLCKRLGADIVYTEFVNSEGLVRNSEKTKKKMMFLEEERPFGIQIYGGEESSMRGAAILAESMNPNIIDINCGCWVKDIAMRGAGAGLLKDLPKMERIVRTVVNSTNKPVTVKTRLGWDENSIRIVEVARMLEQAGVKALTVHCRTRSQGHQGDPDFSWIPKIKQVTSIPVIINGSINTPEDVERLFTETGCYGVMIGRGAINNPWIFRHIKEQRLSGSYQSEISVNERISQCLEHLRLSIEYKGARTGILEMRKYYTGYFKGIPNAVQLRVMLMSLTEEEPIKKAILNFFEKQPVYQNTNTAAQTFLQI